MATGATDAAAAGPVAGHLLMQWDGFRLQWLIGTKRIVHNFGEQPAQDFKELEYVLRDLKGKGLDAEKVIWSQRQASFSVWPAVLAEGVTDEAFALEHNPFEAGKAHAFHSEAFDENCIFLEAEAARLTELVQGVWPQAERCSGAQLWAEAAYRQDNALGQASIYLDVGHKRTLLIRTAKKRLLQAQALPTSEPEGLLYHVVNALHRDGQAPADCGAVVRWSGEVSQGGTRWKLFSRFFPEQEMNVGFRAMQWGDLQAKRERWVALTNLTACA